MNEDDRKRELECLVHLYQFETCWNYYQQCDGKLFDSECRNAAVEFFKTVDAAPELIQMLNESDSTAAAVPLLRKWTNLSQNDLIIPDESNRVFIRLFFLLLNRQLTSKFGVNPVYPFPHKAVEQLQGYLKWRGHLVPIKLELNSDTAMKKANQSESVVVIGDIRRSQELMKYATDPEDSSKRMVEFLKNTRSILFKHGAIFDKFTGDGFVATLTNPFAIAKVWTGLILSSNSFANTGHFVKIISADGKQR